MDGYSVWWIIAAAVIGAVIGALIIRGRLQVGLAKAVAERDAAATRLESLLADRETLANQFKVLADESLVAQQKRAAEQAADRLERTQMVLDPVRDGLNALNQQLLKVEAERAAMTAQLREQVGQVMRAGEELRRETNTLSTALRKPEVRGAWGELQLKRVVEIAGMVDHCSFTTQTTTHTSSEAKVRPDMTVLLGDDKFVHVDSKVPLAAYLDAQNTADPELQAHHMARFASNVKAHIDALSSKKYWTTDTGTPEFVVLFIPSEALGAEALSHAPDLHEYAARRNIVLATPTTLIGMLRAVAYGWRQSALAASAAQVFELGRELHARLASLGSNLEKLGRSLNSSVSAYNATIGSVENRVLVTARRFRDLQVTDEELAELSGVDGVSRTLSAAEFQDHGSAEPAIAVDAGYTADAGSSGLSYPQQQTHISHPKPAITRQENETSSLSSAPSEVEPAKIPAAKIGAAEAVGSFKEPNA